jgi:hypothetical protein
MPEVVIIPEYEPDAIARTVADMWVRYSSNKIGFDTEQKELREYLFATSTRDTANAKLPWKNSTVTPKLTQIRDNLHANYMAALFPNDEWFVWEGDDQDSMTQQKRDAIEGYMRQKLKQSKFEITAEQWVLDYIDAGNVFAGHEFVNLSKTDPATGEVIEGYIGPRAVRVSPVDVVMDPTAASFHVSPFVRRIVRTCGDIRKDLKVLGDQGYDLDVLNKALKLRSNFTDYADQLKSQGLVMDGFGSIEEYFRSGRVELLELWGDIYDEKTEEFYADHVCTVVDRTWLLRCQPNESWLGKRPWEHCGWRIRSDNLWAQGPLHQLIGMQYRIDHLENLQADVFDQIAHPVTKTKGTTVEDFTWGPGENIFCGEDGDVEVLRPDSTALNADMKIDHLMARMEELAGAPKQAMGIRTPGEKTKYEVQTLENGAGRIFQAKINWLEKNVFEPLLNSMLEEARRKMGAKELIPVKDKELGTTTFIEITKDDLLGKGNLRPVGARHFAEDAKFVQELEHTLGAVEKSPLLKPHFSGIALARALEDRLGWRRYGIVKPNVAIEEQMDTQRLMNQAQESLAAEGAAPSEMQPEDFQSSEPAPQQAA